MNWFRRELDRIKNSSLARNAGWMMVGNVFSIATQGITFILLARLLGPMEYGVFAGAFALTGIVAQYSAVGTGTVLLRYVSTDRSRFAVYWGNVISVTLVISGLAIAVMHLFGKSLVSPASATLLILAGISNCLFTQIAVEAGRVFQAFRQLRMTAIITMLVNCVRFITVLVMIGTMHHATAWQWAVASASVSGLAAVLSFGAVSWMFGRPVFSLRILREHGAEGVGYAFAASTTSVYNDVDKAMLSHYGMNVANGIYTMAYRIVDIGCTPISSIQAAAIPEFFRLGQGGVASAATLTRKLMRRSCAIAFVMALGMFLTAPIIPHLLGKGFDEAVSALRWLALIPVFRAVHLLSGCALTGAGLQRHRTIGQIFAGGGNFLLNLWLIPAYGWRGAAWASLVTDGGLAVINVTLAAWLAKRETLCQVEVVQ